MRKVCFFLLLLAFSTAVKATLYDFKVDGIAYTIVDINNMEVEVANDNDETVVNTSYAVGYKASKSSYSGDIDIPEIVTYGGKNFKVVSIGVFAFNECIDVTSITLPSSIKDIKMYAFYGCTALKKFMWPSSVNPK